MEHGDEKVTDAWKQVHDIYEEFSESWEVRPYLKVDALGPDRCVSIEVGQTSSPLDQDQWVMPGGHYCGTHNVGTMREFARAIVAACDFVDAANPEWAGQRLDSDVLADREHPIRLTRSGRNEGQP